MRINLENIGPLKNISIDLANLTVIAGENDSGKSTIGKVLFAITQAYNNYPNALRSQLQNNIKHRLSSILIQLRRNFDLREKPELLELMRPSFQRVIERNFDDGVYELKQTLEQLKNDHPEKHDLLEHLQKRALTLETEVRNAIEKDKMIFSLIHQLLKSEFNQEVSRKESNKQSFISIQDGATKVLEMGFDDHDFYSGISVGEIGFTDSTLVDGPSILQYYNLIGSFDIEDNRFPYHLNDLAIKLRGGAFEISGIRPAVDNDLGDIYKGKVIFDKSERDFFLLKGGQRIKSSNIASGIKALGIIDILIDRGNVADNSLLILDEPETNLHPKWQVELAKTICQLTELGANILVTTHSPYMLEALKVFSEKGKKPARFYSVHKDQQNDVNFVDCTNDISIIINELSEPLINILRMDDEF
ncbi:ATP-binding protein [Chitinibacter fontanus]|uniref:ATP-binding protein n=1 Tax=Chitinibacter fontanus TaxID=1737446 RepID=A0A7D5Z737_9NEIS|nr:AAA family ATPase [Chitinibacter fontanus]QLI81542.1 ATP-binding protein [Chitinibacter fontanus]